MRCALLFVALFVLPCSTAAQERSSRQPDTLKHVRVHLTDGEEVSGYGAGEIGRDSVYRICRGPELRCAHPQLFRLNRAGRVGAIEIRNGTHWGRGALIGGAVGAVVIALAAGWSDDGERSGSSGLVGGAAILLAGTTIGALVGGQSERWTPLWVRPD